MKQGYAFQDYEKEKVDIETLYTGYRAIEADKTLSGAVQTLRVVSASPGTITSASIDYLSYQYSVELIG
jgi:hypothetical protein